MWVAGGMLAWQVGGRTIGQACGRRAVPSAIRFVVRPADRCTRAKWQREQSGLVSERGIRAGMEDERSERRASVARTAGGAEPGGVRGMCAMPGGIGGGHVCGTAEPIKPVLTGIVSFRHQKWVLHRTHLHPC